MKLYLLWFYSLDGATRIGCYASPEEANFAMSYLIEGNFQSTNKYDHPLSESKFSVEIIEVGEFSTHARYRFRNAI